MEERQLETLRDLTKFAPKFLIVKNKSGQLEHFCFNRSQHYVHNKLEEQLKAIGMVRANVVKGRQQGISTYIQGRYFHKVITKKGKKAFILAHEFESTKNLFEMTKRYYDNLEPGLCPTADNSSAKELKFSKFDSGYSVGTAGNKNTGRGQTIQLFHGSEVAYWPNASDIADGVLESVPNEEGTEIILESTANGIGNYFHNRWKEGASGESGYQNIFVPWYWEEKYIANVPGFRPTEEEEKLLEYYKDDGLTIEHLIWRRFKISGFSGEGDDGLDRFKQVYPFTANEAFINPIDNVYINAKWVMRARKAEVESETSLILGCDPAISDNDRTAIIRRKGRLAYGLEVVRNHNTMEIAGKIRRIIEQERPAHVYIDCIGIGAGVVDRLKEMGYECVEGINVARSANDKERFANLRAELWSEMRDWLMQNELPVQIPDDDALHGDLCSLGYKHRSNGQLLLESKDDLRKRGMPSCDTADALMLTFGAGQYVHDTSGFYVAPPAHERGKFF